MIKLLTLPFKALLRFLKLSGVKGSLLLGLGVVIGLLAAPQRGSVTRARLRLKLAQRRTGAADPLVDDPLAL